MHYLAIISQQFDWWNILASVAGFCSAIFAGFALLLNGLAMKTQNKQSLLDKRLSALILINSLRNDFRRCEDSMNLDCEDNCFISGLYGNSSYILYKILGKNALGNYKRKHPSDIDEITMIEALRYLRNIEELEISVDILFSDFKYKKTVINFVTAYRKHFNNILEFIISEKEENGLAGTCSALSYNEYYVELKKSYGEFKENHICAMKDFITLDKTKLENKKRRQNVL